MKNIYKTSLLVLVTSIIFAADQFEEVITEESDNISYQNNRACNAIISSSCLIDFNAEHFQT